MPLEDDDVVLAGEYVLGTLTAFERAEAERRIRAMSRRSFLWGAGAVAATVFGINWLATRRQAAGVQWPFRRLLEVNRRC